MKTRQQLIQFWARHPYWTPEEGAVLAYDLDPKDMIRNAAAGYDRPSIQVASNANHLRDLAYRAIYVAQLGRPSAPIEFMTWAKSVGVEFHADWWDAVAEAAPGPSAATSPPTVPKPDLKIRERESLLKLVIGMAIGGYSWDPKAPRNNATADITSDLHKLGIQLDQDTVLKWLREAAKELRREEQ